MKKLMMTIGAMLMTAGTLADGESFGYQGVLCDDKGKPVSSETKTIAFRLYPAATDGAKLWGRKISVRTDGNGLFNVELSDAQGSAEAGTTNTLATVFATTAKKGQTLYIALEVEGSSGEIRPRQKLLTTPMTSFARDVNCVSDSFVVKGQATFSGGVDVTGGYYNVMPTNTIALWYGTRESVPQGWRICDGSNGTPNMSGKFPVGARKDASDKTDEYAVDKTGGADQVKLSSDQIPAHSHKFDRGRATNLKDKEGRTQIWTRNSGWESSGIKGTTDSTGGGQPHENRPPFRALYFIMRTNG